MHRPIAFCAALTAALLTFASPARSDDTASLTAPPAGITPSTKTLKEVVAQHRRAVRAAQPANTLTETWSVKRGDLSGTQTDIRSGDDFREDTAMGPMHEARGRYRGTQWEENYNGLTVTMTGIHQRDDKDDAALARASEPASGVTLVGEVSQPHPAYVLKVAPPGGRLEYLFYDKTSLLLIRAERVVEDRRVVTTYDDFRDAAGAPAAWDVRESDGRPYNDVEWKLQSVSTGAIDAAKFAIPPAGSAVSLGGKRVALPAKMYDDRVIVTGEMGGRKVNLQLDSGASTILLNRSVADALKFQSFGKQTLTTAGTYTSTRTLVPRIAFGDAVMQNVIVNSAPYEEWEDRRTPVAGLLGFDFISANVIHVDYEREAVEAIDPATFAPPAAAIVLPIRLDDRVPVIEAKVGSAVAKHFILDTGADRSTLFSSFADAHPNETADQGLGQQYAQAYPFFNRIEGVGGEVQITHTQVSALTIGSATFPKFLFTVTHDAPAFESEDFDGLIGQDVLRNFDLYLDYAHLKVYLVPNDRYRQRWGA